MKPVIRTCTLCGQSHAILPVSEALRQAHKTKRIAFVCPACAAQVRKQVEMAAEEPAMQPPVSA